MDPVGRGKKLHLAFLCHIEVTTSLGKMSGGVEFAFHSNHYLTSNRSMMVLIADDIAPMLERQVEVSMYHAMQQLFSGRHSYLRDPLLCCRNRSNFVADKQCVCMQPPICIMSHSVTDMPSGTFGRYPLHVFVIELRQDHQVCHGAALSRVTLAS